MGQLFSKKFTSGHVNCENSLTSFSRAGKSGSTFKSEN
jgi:hypothetical protein